MDEIRIRIRLRIIIHQDLWSLKLVPSPYRRSNYRNRPIYRTCPYNRTPRPFPEKKMHKRTLLFPFETHKMHQVQLTITVSTATVFSGFVFPTQCAKRATLSVSMSIRHPRRYLRSWLKCYDVYECEQRTRISLHICAVWLAYSPSASTMGMYMLIREGSSLPSYEVAGVRRLKLVFAFRTCEKAPFLKSNSCRIYSDFVHVRHSALWELDLHERLMRNPGCKRNKVGQALTYFCLTELVWAFHNSLTQGDHVFWIGDLEFWSLSVIRIENTARVESEWFIGKNSCRTYSWEKKCPD